VVSITAAGELADAFNYQYQTYAEWIHVYDFLRAASLSEPGGTGSGFYGMTEHNAAYFNVRMSEGSSLSASQKTYPKSRKNRLDTPYQRHVFLMLAQSQPSIL